MQLLFNLSWAEISPLVVKYGTKLAVALLVLIIGLWIAGILTKLFKRMMLKRGTDASLVPFLTGIVKTALRIMVVISALGMLGVEMTSFVAVLGAASLAVGMALSGTLQNFAGGVMLLIFKPFKVGDFIEAQGHSGVVKEIQIFNTILTTVDNRVVIIPNGGLSTGSMVNFSAMDTRRVDWSFGIAYGDQVDKAEAVLTRLIQEDERVLKDPAFFIGLGELADSSVNITVRVWVNAADYWGVFFDMNKKVYDTFAKEGLSIPFPQMDVHISKEA